MRADELLYARGLVESRSKARALVEEGKVRCNGVVVDKPSRKCPDDAEISIDTDASALRFVSRAGLKLEGCLEKFGIDLTGLSVLDAGASTGGFTDCALSRGAKSSCCVDVGFGQLHEKLRGDSRVRNLEKTDVRDLSPEFFDGELFDFVCADLSFISLEKVFSNLWSVLKKSGKIVCLVKPQFETDPSIMRRNKGVLRDVALRRAALEKIAKYVSENFADAEFVGETESIVRGGDGNLEYLLVFEKKP